MMHRAFQTIYHRYENDCIVHEAVHTLERLRLVMALQAHDDQVHRLGGIDDRNVVTLAVDGLTLVAHPDPDRHPYADASFERYGDEDTALYLPAIVRG